VLRSWQLFAIYGLLSDDDAGGRVVLQDLYRYRLARRCTSTSTSCQRRRCTSTSTSCQRILRWTRKLARAEDPGGQREGGDPGREEPDPDHGPNLHRAEAAVGEQEQ